MDSKLRQPWSLKTLVSQRKYAHKNNLLHLIVLDNCKRKGTCSENFIRAVLQAFCGASVNARNRHGYTALHLAVIRRNSFMVEKLLTSLPTIDVDAECTNDFRGTALHLAAARTLAVRKTAETMAVYASPSLPLADKKEHQVKIVKILLSRGASARALDHAGCTPFLRAIRDGSEGVVKVLVRRVPLSDNDMYVASPLVKAVIKGCMDDVRTYAGLPGDTGEKLAGFTALHFAVLLRRVDMVDYFASKGGDALFPGADCFDVNARANCLGTPLHMVAENHGADFRPADHSRMARALIDSGAGLELENERGETPLGVAARENLPGLVGLLADAGAELEHRDLLGRTPLHAAARQGALAAVEVLAGRGAVLDARDAGGRTPLRSAVRAGLADVVRFLVDCNVDLNEVDDTDGSTLLHEAVASGCLAVVEALVTKGAVLDARDSGGATPLEMAERQKQREIAEFLSGRVASGVVAALEEPPLKKKRKD